MHISVVSRNAKQLTVRASTTSCSISPVGSKKIHCPLVASVVAGLQTGGSGFVVLDVGCMISEAVVDVGVVSGLLFVIDEFL